MRNPSPASTSCLFVLASLALASAGCTVQTIGGVEPGGSSPAGVTAIAMLGSQVPADHTAYLVSAEVAIQPDSLYVFIGNFDEQCDNPLPPVCEDDPPTSADDGLSQWQLIVGIPAGFQQQGDLSVPDPSGAIQGVVTVGASDSGGPNPATTCGTAPTGLSGDIEVVSIDDTQVTLSFMGVMPQLYAPQGPSSSISAQYKASRCSPSAGP